MLLAKPPRALVQNSPRALFDFGTDSELGIHSVLQKFGHVEDVPKLIDEKFGAFSARHVSKTLTQKFANILRGARRILCHMNGFAV